MIGSNIIITPNPSYSVHPNTLRSEKEPEYQYDYVQPDGGLAEYDNVNIDPNPSYSLPQGDQDVKLQNNPSYIKLKL